MTARGLISLLIYGLFIAGLATRNGSLLMLALPLIGYLAFGLYFAPSAPKLQITRSFSADRVPAGVPVEVTLTIVNQGPLIESLIVEDHLPLGVQIDEGETRILARLDEGESVSLSYSVTSGRGSYHFDTVDLQVSDAFGLMNKASQVSAPGQILVLPAVQRLRDFAIRPRRTRGFSGTIPARQGGPGVAFYGIREYQPGDPTRWVNARVSARSQEQLYVNEFEQERATDVCVVLDVRRTNSVEIGKHSLLEYAVQAAAAASDILLARGNRVALLQYGQSLNWTFPGYGKLQRERILQSLAQASLGDSIAFSNLDQLPLHLFPSRSQLIIISSLIDDSDQLFRSLRARGFQVMVISPDPISFEYQHSPKLPTYELARRVARLEREQRLVRLRRVGVQVVNWDVSMPLTQLAQIALSRPAVFIPEA
jgi:uncharacterized protein (DUF58 family)